MSKDFLGQKLPKQQSMSIIKRFVILNSFCTLFIGWRFLLFVVAFFSTFFLTLKSDYLAYTFSENSLLPFLWPWANFDGVHYLSIATLGYNKFQYAFFPGFPTLIKIFNHFWPDPLLIGFLISNIASLIFILLLNKLWSLDFDSVTVLKGLVLFLVFPSAFFLGSVYTEGLFLAMTVGCFFAARKNHFWYAAILGIAACYTRLVGIFLFPAVFLIWLRGKKQKRDLIPVTLIPLGFLAVLVFNFFQTGDPLAFFHTQPFFGASRSGSNLVILPQVFYRYFKIFLSVNPFSLTYFSALQEILLTIIALIILYFGRKLVRLEYLIFSVGALLLPTLTGTLSSMPRYLLAAWPIFIIAGQILKNKYLFWLVVILLFLLEVVNISLFVNGYWVS